MLYPMKLSYVAKSPIWGGKHLSALYGKTADAPTIGETWELTVRPDEMSVIENGLYVGETLGDFIAAKPAAVCPDFDPISERFPLLVKFIDAADRLSVQVHPDDTYAARVEHDTGKTEMWYVIDAKPGSALIYGLADGVQADAFSAAVADGLPLGPLMRSVPVKAGDCFFLPAGMLHAIGEGILIAEIQQNSDLTYRVWDWERVGADGKPRALHTAKAADVVRAISDDEIDAIRFARGHGQGALVACPYFTVTLADPAHDGVPFCGEATDASFVSLLCVSGEGRLEARGVTWRIMAGDSYFLPAGCGEYTVDGDCRVLVSTL